MWRFRLKHIVLEHHVFAVGEDRTFCVSVVRLIDNAQATCFSHASHSQSSFSNSEIAGLVGVHNLHVVYLFHRGALDHFAACAVKHRLWARSR